ncbi:MAG TPA: AAA family ATPase, partial [Jatrophihabitans sp.]|nr:AAA family ATPase [Jatrophihabitans sp.]
MPLIAGRAKGLLADFSAAGVLAAADVQVAARLGELVGEHDDAALLAAALTVRGTRLGAVVFDLATAADTVAAEAEDGAPVPLAWPPAEEWVHRCAGSPLVTGAGARPLRMVGARMWLTRYWKQEEFVAADLLRRVGGRPDGLDREALERDLAALFDDDDQRAAARIAVASRLSVLAGGPGTGKTTTIARLLAALLRQQPAARVALAAPTGKAAARLAEAVQGARDRLTAEDRARLAALPASTLHRLLRRRPGRSSRFVHDRDNRLPFDVVVVDECSMVPLTMMARLLEALPPAARLVLVGDPDQLASVEAGAVLGDLVPGDAEPAEPLRASVARLTTVRRYTEGSSTDTLAKLIRAGRSTEVLELLTAGPPGLEFSAVPDDEPV